jgi:glycosyltransferase involved in cell wall biosynthesis
MNDVTAPPVYVSVCLITYNQEKYIGQAIESIISQKTNVPFELVIGEDRSPDGTRRICEEYQMKYPSIVRLLPSEKNYGMMANLMRTLNNTKGKYVAFCEGDDFWTDAGKLQKQIDFLDNNADYVLVGHGYTKLYPNDTTEVVDNRPEKRNDFTIDDYIMSHFIHFNTLMYRNAVRIPEWFSSMSVGDQNLIFYVSQFGKIGYIPESMSMYRINEESFMHTNKLPRIIRNFIRDLEVMNEKTNYKYKERFDLRIRLEELMYSFWTHNYFIRQLTVCRNLPFLMKYRKYIFKDGFSFYKLLVPTELKTIYKAISKRRQPER